MAIASIADLSGLTVEELLRLHAAVVDELMQREVVRTRNNPLGDYTEWLVCERLGLEIQPNSKASYDGVAMDGTRYQIKGRRAKRGQRNVQMSVIRNLESCGFDYLVAVVFNPDYSIRHAIKAPHSLVARFAAYRQHVNGHAPIVSEKLLAMEGVEDLSSVLAP